MTASGMPFQGWIASLSNGETIHEWEPGGGERSAWHRLLAKCKNENLTITQMRLQRNGVTINGMAGQKGYVHLKKVQAGMNTGVRKEWWGIGSVLGNVVVITWLDENKNVLQDFASIDSVFQHSSL